MKKSSLALSVGLSLFAIANVSFGMFDDKAQKPVEQTKTEKKIAPENENRPIPKGSGRPVAKDIETRKPVNGKITLNSEESKKLIDALGPEFALPHKKTGKAFELRKFSVTTGKDGKGNPVETCGFHFGRYYKQLEDAQPVIKAVKDLRLPYSGGISGTSWSYDRVHCSVSGADDKPVYSCWIVPAAK